MVTRKYDMLYAREAAPRRNNGGDRRCGHGVYRAWMLHVLRNTCCLFVYVCMYIRTCENVHDVDVECPVSRGGGLLAPPASVTVCGTRQRPDSAFLCFV